MKFARAFSPELNESVTPYQARELYTDEDSPFFEQKLRFLCEDKDCRAKLTPVGIYMTRKSKRALHFREDEPHSLRCEYCDDKHGGKRTPVPGQQEDDFKLTDFPTELLLDPPKRRPGSGGGTATGGDGGDGSRTKSTGGIPGSDAPRKTSSKTRYLDQVVDCFLYGDDSAKNNKFTIGDKTKPFSKFFKSVKFLTDGQGYIYHGEVDSLKPYSNAESLGIKFTEKHWNSNKKPLTVWVYISKETIDKSRRKKFFRAEVQELEKAINNGEKVRCFFVGTNPHIQSNPSKFNDGTYETVNDELQSNDHISFVFEKDD